MLHRHHCSVYRLPRNFFPFDILIDFSGESIGLEFHLFPSTWKMVTVSPTSHETNWSMQLKLQQHMLPIKPILDN